METKHVTTRNGRFKKGDVVYHMNTGRQGTIMQYVPHSFKINWLGQAEDYWVSADLVQHGFPLGTVVQILDEPTRPWLAGTLGVVVGVYPATADSVVQLFMLTGDEAGRTRLKDVRHLYMVGFPADPPWNGIEALTRKDKAGRHCPGCGAHSPEYQPTDGCCHPHGCWRGQ